MDEDIDITETSEIVDFEVDLPFEDDIYAGTYSEE